MTQKTFLPRGEQSVIETIATYCQQRPELKNILEAFQPVLEKRETLAESFSSNELKNWPLLDVGRWQMDNEGVPMLAGVPLSFLASWLETSRQEMMLVLQEAMPDGKELKKANAAFEHGILDPVACLEALIAGDEPGIKCLADKAEVSEPVLRFAVSMISSPVLEALAIFICQQHLELSWKEGFCPICGSFPSLAVLSRRENIDLDSLVGGGGKKFLHCSLCGHEWHFRRDACPACKNAEPGSREMFYAAKAKQERIEVCTKCESYLPCIDLREYFQDPNPFVASIGLMHLDIIAKEKGFQPLTPAPWNTF